MYKLKRSSLRGRIITGLIVVDLATGIVISSCSPTVAEASELTPKPGIEATHTQPPIATPIEVLESTPTPDPTPSIISELGVLNENKNIPINIDDIYVLEYQLHNEYIDAESINRNEVGEKHTSFVRIGTIDYDYYTEYRNIFTDEVLFTNDPGFADVLFQPTKGEYIGKYVMTEFTKTTSLRDYIKERDPSIELRADITYGELEEIYKRLVSKDERVETDLELYLPLTEEEKESIERLNIPNPDEITDLRISVYILEIDGENRVVFGKYGTTHKDTVEIIDVFSNKSFMIEPRGKVLNQGYYDIPMLLNTPDNKEVKLLAYFDIIGFEKRVGKLIQCKKSKYSDLFLDNPINSSNLGRDWKKGDLAEYIVETVPEENIFFVAEYMASYQPKAPKVK